MTQAACGAALGVSRQAIHKQVAKGKLPLIDGKVDLDVARAVFAATLDPAKSKILRNAHEAEIKLAAVPPIAPAGASATPPAGQPASDPLTNYHLAKTLRENYEARRAKLSYEQELGTLVKADEVRAAASRLAILIGAGLDMMPARVVSMLRAEPDQTKQEAIVEAECRRLREDFAKQATALLAFDPVA